MLRRRHLQNDVPINGNPFLLSATILVVSCTDLDAQTPEPIPKRQPVIGFVRNASGFDEAGCTLSLADGRKYSDKRPFS